MSLVMSAEGSLNDGTSGPSKLMKCCRPPPAEPCCREDGFLNPEETQKTQGKPN